MIHVYRLNIIVLDPLEAQIEIFRIELRVNLYKTASIYIPFEGLDLI